jgi:hypothetical protein
VQKLYPAFVKKFEDKEASEDTRVRATARIGQIASLGSAAPLKREAEKKLLEIWFSNDTKVDRRLGNELTQQLACLCSKHLFEEVKTKSKRAR